MTRKDYILIAEALRVQRHRAELEIIQALEPNTVSTETDDFAYGRAEGIDAATMELCDSLRRDNPRFNTEHFLAVVRGEKDLNSRPSRKAGV